MAVLTESDLRLIKNFVAWPRGFGYVLDHSDRTFSDFFRDEFGVNIDDEKFYERGSSKGNRLVSFCEKEPAALVARVLKKLWVDANQSAQYQQKMQFEKPVLTLIERLEGQVKLEVIEKPLSKSQDNILERYTEEPLVLPEQERAVKFKVNLNGEIDLDPQFGEVNVARVDVLRPGILELIAAASVYFSQEGNYFDFVDEVLIEYRNLVEKPAEEIDFGHLFIAGTEIQAALDEARSADGGGNTPKIPRKYASKVQALITAHRALMMASEVGTDLVADTEIYDETPTQARAARKDILEMRDDIKESEGVFSNDAKNKVVAGLNGGGVKEDLFARKLARNVGIVTAGVVAVGAGPAIGLASVAGGVAVSIIGGVGLLFGGGSRVTKAGDELLQDFPIAMNAGLERIRVFTIEKRHSISKAAGVLGAGTWFTDILQAAIAETTTDSDIFNPKSIFGPAIYILGFDLKNSSKMSDGLSLALKKTFPGDSDIKIIIGKFRDGDVQKAIKSRSTIVLNDEITPESGFILSDSREFDSAYRHITQTSDRPNFSVVGGKIYLRENGELTSIAVHGKLSNRIEDVLVNLIKHYIRERRL